MKNYSLTKRISNLLIFIYFSLFFVSNVILPFGKLYSSYAIIVEFIIFLLVFVLNLELISKDKKVLTLSLIIVVLATISLIVTGGGVGSLMNLARFLMGLLFFSNVEIDKKGKNKILFICFIMWLFYLALSPHIWALYKNGNSPTNPNTVGVLLFFTSTVIGNYLLKRPGKKWVNCIFAMVLYVLTFVAITNTQCRSAFLAMSGFLIMNYVPFLKTVVLRIKRIVMYLISIVGAFFPTFYSRGSLSGIDINSLISYSEKDLYTGREYLWGKMIEGLNSDGMNYITGVGTNYRVTDGSVFNNYHNWYFGMIYAFGVLIYLLYFYVFIKLVERINDYAIICGIISLMIVGFFETIGLNGATQTCIFIYFVLGREK